MGRPRSKLRTPAERAAYGELMQRVAELKAQQRATAERELPHALLEFYVPKARKVLIDAFAQLNPDERHALALKLTDPDDD